MDIQAAAIVILVLAGSLIAVMDGLWARSTIGFGRLGFVARSAIRALVHPLSRRAVPTL